MGDNGHLMRLELIAKKWLNLKYYAGFRMKGVARLRGIEPPTLGFGDSFSGFNNSEK